MAVAVIGDTQDTVDSAHCSSNTGTDDPTDRAAHRAGDPVAFISTFMGATDDALGMTSLRQATEREKNSGGREGQTHD